LICNEDHRFIVAEQMRQIGVEPERDPAGTDGPQHAPPVTVAALQATANGEDPLLLVLAADHLIRDAAQFRQAIDAGRKPAEEGRLVTFGIVPTAPETGYGYIEASETFSQGGPAHVPINALWRNPTKPQQSSSWQPAVSPGTAECSCSAPAPCWRNWSVWPQRW
jgi:mannose-1-phosphate guanylyltransferase